MPLLDVSDILASPEFADTLTLTRNTQTVGADGIAVNATVVTDFSGVVTSDSGRDLMRQAQGEMVQGTILVHTVTNLTSGAAGLDADEIVWNGARYTVTTIDDYSRYGVGFVCATCELKPLAGS